MVEQQQAKHMASQRLSIAQVMRAGGAESFHSAALFASFPAALTSAALALGFGPLLARLPGLTPIRRRSW